MTDTDHAPGTYDEGATDDRADELARNRRVIAGYRQADQPRTDLLQDWLDFGEHNWVWQLLHRKPRAAS